MIDEDLVLQYYLLFSGCSISSLFLFPCVSVCHFGLVVSYDIFLSFLFLCFMSLLCAYVLWLPFGLYKTCHRFNSLFSADGILSSLTYMSFFSFSSSNFMCLLSQIIPFYTVCSQTAIAVVIFLLSFFLPLTFRL